MGCCRAHQTRCRDVAVLLVCLGAALASAQPTWISKLPGPPSSCSADLIKGIQWGTATSAYQVEGGWNADGRSASIWDTLAQTAGRIADNTTGNVAVDMYHRWQSDIDLMKSLGIKHYRMSISWPRIVPGGVAGSPVNAAGLRWYRTLITALLAAGIKPAVTLFHWDLPQVLQDKYEGFLSPKVQDDYLYYADAVFAHLGDLVDQWMTFNEVISICENGYELDVFAPAMKGGKRAKYACGHNVLLAHARAVALYRAKYAPTQGGRVSIALDGKWGFPRDPSSAADVQAAENFMLFQYGWMADPLYFGDYPAVMRDTQGPDLPRFTAQESALLRATTVDFFSVNFYCGYYVWAPKPGSPKSMTYDVGDVFTSPGAPTNAAWLFKTPDGFRHTLVWLHKRYNGPEIWVTENGVSGPQEESKGHEAAVRDEARLEFYREYIDNMCAAKRDDGVQVTHYFAWSLMDNFEWRDGFSRRFGLVYVDLQDNLTRHPKSSAFWFKKNFFEGSSPAFTAKQKAAAGGKAADGGANAAAKPAPAPAAQQDGGLAAKTGSIYRATLSKVKSWLPFSLDLHSDVLGVRLQLNTGDDAERSPQ